jgi:hypothetical protein
MKARIFIWAPTVLTGQWVDFLDTVDELGPALGEGAPRWRGVGGTLGLVPGAGLEPARGVTSGDSKNWESARLSDLTNVVWTKQRHCAGSANQMAPRNPVGGLVVQHRNRTSGNPIGVDRE